MEMEEARTGSENIGDVIRDTEEVSNVEETKDSSGKDETKTDRTEENLLDKDEKIDSVQADAGIGDNLEETLSQNLVEHEPTDKFEVENEMGGEIQPESAQYVTGDTSDAEKEQILKQVVDAVADVTSTTKDVLKIVGDLKQPEENLEECFNAMSGKFKRLFDLAEIGSDKNVMTVRNYMDYFTYCHRLIEGKEVEKKESSVEMSVNEEGTNNGVQSLENVNITAKSLQEPEVGKKSERRELEETPTTSGAQTTEERNVASEFEDTRGATALLKCEEIQEKEIVRECEEFQDVTPASEYEHLLDELIISEVDNTNSPPEPVEMRANTVACEEIQDKIDASESENTTATSET